MHVGGPQSQYPSSSGVNIPVQHMDPRHTQRQAHSPSQFSPGYPVGQPTGMPMPGTNPVPLHHQQQPFPRPGTKQPTAWEIPVQREAPPVTRHSNHGQYQTEWSAGPTVTANQSGQKLGPETAASEPSLSRGASPSPVYMSPLEIVQQINKEADELQEKVNQFVGIKTDKNYRFLEEMLTRLLLKLDSIESDGKEEIRTIRRQAVKTVQASIDHLELRAMSSDVRSDGQDGMANCNASNNQNSDETNQVANSGGSANAQTKTGVTEMVLDSEQQC